MNISAFLHTCNENQKSAVCSSHLRNGPVFIIAGAGSGKTFVLTHRILFLLHQHISPESVLALTFTEAAASEMKQRVQTALENTDLSITHHPAITTFHGLGYRIIRDRVNSIPNWQRLGFSACPKVIDQEQKSHFVHAIRKSLELTEKDELVFEWLESPFFSSRKDTESCSASDDDKRLRLQNSFKEYLLEHNLLTFGDMVNLSLKLFKEHPEAETEYRQKFKHILVDEYQDTSPDQFALIKAISSPEHRLYLVGDDDQAIYGFRGADKNCITKLFEQFPEMKVVKLEINYRSTANILKFANTIFKDKPLHLQKKLRPGRVGGNPVYKRNFKVVHKLSRTSLAEAGWIANQINLLREQFKLNWEDFAFLYRLNRQADYLRNMVTHYLGSEAASRIRFMTIHKAKGLQFPVVFLPGLENGTFPYKHGGRDLTPERMEEERRLFYVGVTRAESLLCLCACRKKMFGGKMRKYEISPFLLQSGSWLQRLKIKFWDRVIN